MKPSFNLWSEPWITILHPDGATEEVNLASALLRAHEYVTLYEASPLVVCALHRHLVAILQAAINLDKTAALRQLWRAGRFPPENIQPFGEAFAHRFDLFSAEQPFLQSADLPLKPEKQSDAKSVGYLFPEQPAGTAVTHYTHLYDEDQVLCAVCAAKGLLLIPPFASSGGAGIKPSINGVPPLYVLPGGNTYFQSLTASLTSPGYQPPVADPEQDTPWWLHDPVVGKKAEVHRVGYLHSLTFPARRVRLHPTRMTTPCSRCGRHATWGTASMVYEMGESRPKDAAFWQDPFAAYRLSNQGDKVPVPIRPVEGRATWREFAGLFLPDRNRRKYRRPAVIDQLEELYDVLPYEDGIPLPFRTIGLRTDMKMKVFEWAESGVLVPPAVLRDEDVARRIEQGIEFASDCAGISRKVFHDSIGGPAKSERFQRVRQQMGRRYWQTLGEKFHNHLFRFQSGVAADVAFHEWLDIVLHEAIAAFQRAVRLLPKDGVSLRQQVEGVNACRARLYGFRKKHYPREQKEQVV